MDCGLPGEKGKQAVSHRSIQHIYNYIFDTNPKFPVRKGRKSGSHIYDLKDIVPIFQQILWKESEDQIHNCHRS